ncbi:DUF2794 domain-containing protein [Paramagnetospirillum kuznetsovii]|uniref:DUF2794 domain-containing protein n=1 Tax=Paramagnetospirillum kuznetsovii TaxID=2053833 RepID=A0A364NVN9_9PROT|nr:DUF2794 domain-containing protein [Paramagnetospirillum kuznetsovii]RAU20977.1 DUF2794 domain-containing protein [Paramagnetospirillum kuznetsovii]
MATLVRMADYRARPAFVQFERAELCLLLALYAGRVAAGEWRDYAIDLGADQAVFSVFRHTRERPLFTIAKEPRKQAWVVRSGGRELARSDSLADVLTAVQQKPRPV